jgi:hypothetical protein
MICARQGCERQARGDEYCSVFCAKIDAGVITEAEDKIEKKEARVRRNEIRVDAENTSVNRERHVGPAARRSSRRVRRTSG